MKICACAIQRRAKHDDKARNKNTTGREQRHLNEYTLGCLREQTKWPAGVPIRLQLEFCIFAKRLFYGKTHVVNQVIAALRRSVGLPGRLVTVWKNQTGQTHTQLL